MAELYEPVTWERTPRLVALAEGAETPTPEEIGKLWEVFQTGYDELGIPATLAEFADWLTGRDGWEGVPPCDVTW